MSCIHKTLKAFKQKLQQTKQQQQGTVFKYTWGRYQHHRVRRKMIVLLGLQHLDTWNSKLSGGDSIMWCDCFAIRYTGRMAV